MKQSIIILLLFLSVPFFSWGQIDFDNYTFLKSEGPIPNDFTDFSYEKYTNNLADYDTKTEAKIKDIKKGYVAITSYSIQKMLRNGMVTFNDPLSQYANKILDHLLKNNPQLRSKVRVYTLKTTEANAFSVNNGIIFISVGLFSQIQNEAQLAFVLSHELIHYVNGHHAKDFITQNQMRDDKNISHNDKLNSLFSYSKEQELEADKEGFKRFFKPAGYAISEVSTSFDMLLYSSLPFDEVEFKLDYFNSDGLIFPDTFKVKTYNEITAQENNNDTKQTHPNILKRRTYINVLMEDEDLMKGKKYIVSEDEYKYTQKIARFELSHLYRIENQFEKAIYNNYLLSQKYPNNKYLETNFAEDLYGLNFYKNRGRFSKAHKKSSKIEGYSQQVNYIFDKISKDELNLMTLRYNWKLLNKYPDDKYISQLSDSVISDIAKYYSEDLLALPKKLPKQKTDTSLSSENELAYNKLTKTEKIRHKKNKNKRDSYFFYTLVGLKNKSDLFDLYSKKVINKDKTELSYEELSSKAKLEKKQKKKELRQGKSIGVDKTILLPPYYEMGVLGKDADKKINAYNKKKENFIRLINKTTKKLNIETIDLSLENISTNDIKKFNDYSIFTQWIIENNSQNLTGFILSGQKYLNEISKKYGTKYLTWIGLENNYYNSVLKVYTINLETGEMVYPFKTTIKKSATDVMKSNLYYALVQLKRKPKNK